jgi:8-oxo-dGTP pyrophosphatase MutT (NUDIX family)
VAELRTDNTGTRDWGAVIRAKLAGSQPRHERQDWIVPGMISAPDDATYRRSLPPNPAAAAVLIPLIEGGRLSVLFTQRASGLRTHGGQVSFPGGRVEAHDGTPQAAALREAREEIGLEERFVSIAGYLPDHVVISGFRITPVVGFVRPGFELSLDHSEVQRTFEVPVDYIFDARNFRRQPRRLMRSGEEVEFCDIPFGEHVIWGATAGMLLTLYRVCVGPWPDA